MSKIDAQRARIEALTNKTVLRGDDSPAIRDTFAQLAAINRVGASTLAIQDDGVIDLRGIKVTPTGADIPAGISTSDFVWAIGMIAQLEQALQWVIGDLIAFGLAQYGDLGTWAESFARDRQTLSNWASICRSIPKTSRQRELSFTHHSLVANHPNRDGLLALAIQNKWSVAKLREFIAGELPAKRSTPWQTFETRVFALAKKEDKHDLAQRLRALADQIENT